MKTDDHRVRILSIDIDRVDFQETVEQILTFVAERRPRYVCTANVDHVVQCVQDEEFRQIYQDAALAVPDGVPLLWAARLLGKPLKERVNGTNLFERLCARAAERGHRVFFLGGPPGVADGAASVLRQRYPGLQVAGTYAPPFGFERDPEENARVVDRIRRAAPDVLFVGFGAPKQEKWIYRHLRALQVPVSLGIGASFEYVAGTTKRAPAWMQSMGLEWFYRVLENPRRYWRRYLVQDLKFVPLVLRQALSEV